MNIDYRYPIMFRLLFGIKVLSTSHQHLQTITNTYNYKVLKLRIIKHMYEK